MSVKINKNLIIPAILLIVPVTLILLFDPNAWKSWYALITEIIELVFFVDVPIGMCLWHWYRPDHFRGLRLVIQAGLLTLASWAFVSALMWIGPRNGFAVVCAYVLGWSYIWFFMIPIGAVYLIFRGVLKLFEVCRRRWNIPETAKAWIRNILLGLLPLFFLVCGHIFIAFGLGRSARGFVVLFLISGIGLPVYFVRTCIFRQAAWGKVKKILVFLLFLLLWGAYIFYSAMWHVVTLRILQMDAYYGGILCVEESPDSRIDAFYFDDGEFGNHCYAVRIHDPRIESLPLFHTRASVFHRVKARWEGIDHFVFDSSDIGVIDFRYQDGKWTATPESLLISQEEMKPENLPESGKQTSVLMEL